MRDISEIDLRGIMRWPRDEWVIETEERWQQRPKRTLRATAPYSRDLADQLHALIMGPGVVVVRLPGGRPFVGLLRECDGVYGAGGRDQLALTVEEVYC